MRKKNSNKISLEEFNPNPIPRSYLKQLENASAIEKIKIVEKVMDLPLTSRDLRMLSDKFSNEKPKFAPRSSKTLPSFPLIKKLQENLEKMKLKKTRNHSDNK